MPAGRETPSTLARLVERAPLPPHERAWRHPSELAEANRTRSRPRRRAATLRGDRARRRCGRRDRGGAAGVHARAAAHRHTGRRQLDEQPRFRHARSARGVGQPRTRHRRPDAPPDRDPDRRRRDGGHVEPFDPRDHPARRASDRQIAASTSCSSRAASTSQALGRRSGSSDGGIVWVALDAGRDPITASTSRATCRAPTMS